MAYYHAMKGRDMLLRGIREQLPPDAEVFLAPLKLPYQALEKIALEQSDNRWTTHSVIDLGGCK
jgi:hypothetical protein